MLTKREVQQMDQLAQLDRAFQDYVNQAAALREQPPASATLEEDQKIFLKMISDVPKVSEELTYYKLMISGLSFYIRYVISGDHNYLNPFHDFMESILSNQSLFMRLPLQNEVYDKYFVLCTMLSISGAIATYHQSREMLDYLEQCRNYLEKYILKWDDRNDSYLVAARYLFISLCYEYSFIPYLKSNKSNTQLKTFVDRPSFERYYKKFKERLQSRAKQLSSEEECFSYLLEALQCRIAYSKEMLKPSKENPDSFNIEFQRYLAIFIGDEFFQFLERRSAEKETSAFSQLPELGLGCNVYVELAFHVMELISHANAVLTHRINTCQSDAIKLDPSHQSWSYLYRLLTLKQQVLHGGIRLYSYPIIQNFIPAAQVTEYKVHAEQTLKEIRQRLAVLDYIKADFVAKQNCFVAQFLKEQEDRKQFVSIRKKKTVHKNNSSTSKKSTSSSRKDDSAKLDKEEDERDDIAEVGVLLGKKQFQEAIARYRVLLTQEEKNGDKNRLIYLYMCLGDAHHYHSNYIDDPKNKASELRLSELYYKKCLQAIDGLGEAIQQDEAMKSLKSFVQSVLDSRLKEDNHKNVSTVPVVAIPSPVTTAAIPPSASIACSSTEQAIPQPISSTRTYTLRPSFTFYPCQLRLPDYLLSVMNTLYHYGYDAYLVGGAVRDSLLGSLANDYDVATNAPWYIINALFANVGEMVGNLHPVFLVKSFAKSIQISPMKALLPGATPEIVQMNDGTIISHHGTQNIAEDALSRDYTCNALYYDPRHFMIYDPFDGYHHTTGKHIVFITEPSTAVSKDPSLILRAMRLMIRFKFMVNQTLETLMCSNVVLLNRMNAIRLRQELDKTKGTVGDDKTKKELMKKYNLLQLDASVSSCDQALFSQRINLVPPQTHAITEVTPGDYPGSIVLNGVTYFPS